MQSHWYGGVKKAKIAGNRLEVFIDLLGKSDPWSVINGKKHRFADMNEARRLAEQKGFDDGIKITVARGYGLKPRIDKLT